MSEEEKAAIIISTKDSLSWGLDIKTFICLKKSCVYVYYDIKNPYLDYLGTSAVSSMPMKKKGNKYFNFLKSYNVNDKVLTKY